ncbi:MAG: S-layer homology domain-containing protein [Bacillota bacterium]|nr:S-layer homology domain-containing protein [Bacillota bacterium]
MALVLTLAMVLSLVPVTALAADGNEEGTPSAGSTIYVDAMNGNDAQEGVGTTAEKAYQSLEKAVTAAASGDTIQLSEGKYSTYGNASPKKSLTFVGAESGKTEWYIGSPTPDQHLEGTEYNGDYSFDSCENITFQKIKFNVYPSTYKGFIRINNVELDECEINGMSTYWGYKTTTFRKTVFNCPSDYALWYYTGHEMTFDGCTFNSKGKIVNAYREAMEKTPLVLNFKDCTVENTGSAFLSKQVLNIKDDNNDYIVNISGTNTVTGVKPNGTTCSRWFQVKSVGKDKPHYATVNIDGETVWKEGKMVSHAIDTTHDKYTDGYKDNAFKYSYGEWTKNPDGTKTREVTKTCKYCGYQEKTTENAPADPIEWDVSKSKTATPLNTRDWTSDVTLSLPSAEEKLESDVVFVIDKSQCGKESATAAQQLVDNLLKRQKVTNAKIKVGIVIFGGTAIVSRELSEVTEAKELWSAMDVAAKTGLHGSNVQSGLIEADQMLSKDTEVANSRKYVVLISDGHTYQFSKEKEYEAYIEKGKSFNALKTYGIYNENDLYAYSHGISYTIHSMHDQYYTGDYTNDGTYKDGWSGSYLTDAQYKTGTLGNSNEVGNVYEMPYGTWSQYLEHITSVVTADNGKYDVLLTHTNGDYDYQCIGNNATTSREERATLANSALGAGMYIKCGLDETGKDNQLMHASGTDRAVYEAYTKYASMAKKYNCYPIYVSKDNTDPNNYDAAKTTQDYGYQLIHAMGEISHNTGTSVAVANEAIIPNKISVNVTSAFSSIQNDILYAVSAGSIVTDTIGEKFTFGGVDSFTLKVGTEKIEGVKDTSDENTVNFGDLKPDNSYPYTVTYTPDTKTFVWTINENVSNFAPVQLTYTVKLTTPETDPGTYGTEDLKGEKDVPADKALFTNESAVLNAINSAGAPVKEQAFPKPSVSYTVKNSHRPGGSGGGTVTIPDDVPTGLNGKDHYAYVVGYPDGMVYPQKNITRAEVATIFFRLLTDETREANMTKSNGYNDMKDGAWYTCAVSTLSKMGIIKGYEDGSFKPDASISRAEFAAIAARFDPDGDKTPATFSDVSSHWAKDEISIAANHGWIKGYEDGSFKPDQKITRAETMTLVNRVLKRLPETKDDLHKDMKTWPDNQNESAWFYLAVQEATNSHYQKLKKDGTHETWESMRETRDWAALEK